MIVLGTFAVLALLVVVVLKNTAFKTMPELQGEPQVGKWYRITPMEAKSSDGSEWHGLLRLGSEDKVIVYFFGGGVCLDEYTAAHPQNLYTVNVKSQDTLAEGGIGSSGHFSGLLQLLNLPAYAAFECCVVHDEPPLACRFDGETAVR